jgi:hypothetical protein
MTSQVCGAGENPPGGGIKMIQGAVASINPKQIFLGGELGYIVILLPTIV